ncbi:MAG: Gfo/Idh/MocA family oxidoreductase, partial [Clostridia bacterium]|nr:Gfo/Idh/MocA family oxidoreductase [Clostridia bacterium]
MKEKINIGYIGLGRRGRGMLKACFSQMNDVNVKTICDISEERIEMGKQLVLEKGGYTPASTTDYHEILADPEIDAVVIMTGWSGRLTIAKESMLAGKYTAIEVGCADTLDECFELVETYEKTGVPVMMLENCCYGRREMMLLNMIKQGLF